MDGARLSQILQRLHECLPNLKILLIKNNEVYINLYDTFTVAGEDEEDGHDDVGTYQMEGNNFKSLLIQPGLEEASNKDMIALYQFVGKNGNIKVAKVLDTAFDVWVDIYKKEIEGVDKVLQERHWEGYGLKIDA